MDIKNPYLTTWIEKEIERLSPSNVIWIDGSKQQLDEINDLLIKQGVFTPLNPISYPNSFWCISDPSDVARVEDRTFLCSSTKDEAGPTNNWMDPKKMYSKLDALLSGIMKGRTMYVIPYLMGPDGSPYAKVGFEITDSPYVVANMEIMARCGEVALKNLGNGKDFVKGVHSMGKLDPENRYICHFPEDNLIVSINTNYGGNVLQGKKCFALRIASNLGRKEGWLAEHMLILGIKNPKGEKIYICAAFPSACGKTNLAMLIPPKSYLDKGWEISTVGDDISWLNFGKDGRLYAINPESGFFGVAPGTSYKTNPNAMESVKGNSIFTNTAINLDDMTPWWEGMENPPVRAKNWKNEDWPSNNGEPGAHPNSRFTAPARQCPCIDPEWESPNGVPISAIVFGARRTAIMPLVFESRNWQHGTFVGATMASLTTAAQQGAVNKLRHDPMAMTPFCGYNICDYFAHWLKIGRHSGARLPRIYHVNWFRTSDDGSFLWPGFGDNMRVLEWIFNRVHGQAGAAEAPIGYLPRVSDFNCEGLKIPKENLDILLSVNREDWKRELGNQKEFLQTLGSRLPQEIWEEHKNLEKRLGN